MRLICLRDFNGLKPVGDRDRELLGKLKLGAEVVVEIKRPRNLKQLKLYWSLIHLIFPQQSRYPTEEDLSDAIKCAVGHCEETPLKSGKIMVRPKSISFSKTDQSQWEAFFNAVIQLVITKIIPGVNEADLRRELEDMTGLSKEPR